MLPSAFASGSSALRFAWFPMLRFLLPVLSFPVCFLSPFPDSLPQLFLRCLLSHFPLPVRFLSFASLSLPATQLDCSSFLLLQVFASQRLFPRASVPFVPSAFPLLSSPVSRSFLPVLLTQLPVGFLSSFPVSLPQPFHRCFPFRSLLRDRCLTSTSFRPLPF